LIIQSFDVQTGAMRSAGNKFDKSSSSQKKPLHANINGQRGSHVAGSMNRSASFRDKTENPILSSLPSMSQNTSTPKQEDVTNFLQCSRVDPKAMASEYKFNHHGDFKKHANDALAPNASPDDLKKLKACLRESITKGRHGAASISAQSSAPKPEQEKYTAGGPTNAKLHAPARGQRSGSMALARFSTVLANASNDRELPNIASQNSGPVGPTTRKRTLPVSSSSPPVTQWADRRPQKISRTARTNIVPVSPSSTSLEIQESCATKKKKLVNGNDHKIGIPKQLSTTKLSLDKPKSVRSKRARPHTRRSSDRKANSRQEPTSGSIQSVVPTTKRDVDSFGDIQLCQRLLSALIPKDGDDNENDDTESNGFIELCYGKESAREFHNESVCRVSDYQTMSMDKKLLMEIRSIGLYRELMVGALFSDTLVGSGHGSKQDIFCMGRVLSETLSFPNVVQKADDDIDGLISDLENKYHEQVSRKTSVLDKLLKTTTEAKALQEK
nr:hypothetical protein [Tanacetum cinerariifolium]